MLRESVDSQIEPSDGFGYFEIDIQSEAARQKREGRADEIITKIFESAQVGLNPLSPAKFMTLAGFAYEPEAMPKEYRNAIRTGVITWTQGITFHRVESLAAKK